MSARVVSVVVAFAIAASFVACFAACAGQEQSLGGPPSPEPATVPTTWIAAHSLCPPTMPAEGSVCATYDEADAAVAKQCHYRPEDGCEDVCVCGYNGGWSCFHAACGILTDYACKDGDPCLDGVGCTTATHDCRCVDDELSCAPRRIP